MEKPRLKEVIPQKPGFKVAQNQVVYTKWLLGVLGNSYDFQKNMSAFTVSPTAHLAACKSSSAKAWHLQSSAVLGEAVPHWGRSGESQLATGYLRHQAKTNGKTNLLG